MANANLRPRRAGVNYAPGAYAQFFDNAQNRNFNPAMRLTGSYSLSNALGMANTAADFLTMGAVSDTRRFVNAMLASNPDQTWTQAIGHRVEQSARYGLRMGARYYAASYIAGRQVPAAVGALAQPLGRAASYLSGGLLDRGLEYAASSVASMTTRFGAQAAHQAARLMAGSAILGGAYSSVADRLAAWSTVSDAQRPAAGRAGRAMDFGARAYYRVVHGETIRTTGWENVGGVGSTDTNAAMGRSAHAAVRGMPYRIPGIEQHRTAFYSWEWLHLRGNALGGRAVRANLAGGAHGANTEMIPGERVLGTAPAAQVNTTAFLRAGSDAARALVFRGASAGRNLFSQHIDADRWPVTRSENRRITAAVTPARQYPYIPSSIQSSALFQGGVSVASAAYNALPSRAAIGNAATAAYNMIPSGQDIRRGAAAAGAAVYNRLPAIRNLRFW